MYRRKELLIADRRKLYFTRGTDRAFCKKDTVYIVGASLNIAF